MVAAFAQAKKDQMIARARTAKTSQKVNDMLSSVTGNTSMDAFERMKEKVEMLESKAEVGSYNRAERAWSRCPQTERLILDLW